MDTRKLITLSFDANVGALDRVHRLFVGAALVGLAWSLAWPMWASVTASVLGAMWFVTGILSKCTIYYVLGVSSCPGNTTQSREKST